MEVGVIIPARLGSIRFPEKILADLNGKSVLQHVYDRCVQADVGRVIVAAPYSDMGSLESSGFLGDICYANEPVDDVLGRLKHVAKHCRFDWIIRVNGDSPLIEPDDIQQLAAMALSGDPPPYACYMVGNVRRTVDIPDQPAQPEAFTYREVCRWVDEIDQLREHVVPFKTSIMRSFQPIATDRVFHKTTVDTPEDLERLREWMSL